MPSMPEALAVYDWTKHMRKIRIANFFLVYVQGQDWVMVYAILKTEWS